MGNFLSTVSSFETERLSLRKPVPEDASTLCKILKKPGVRAFGVSAAPPSVEGVSWWIKSLNDNQGCWVIFDKITQDLFGVLTACPGNGKDEYELGYIVDPDYWGGGLCTETVCGLVQTLTAAGYYGTLIIIAAVDNYASVRVAEKAGFTFVENTTYFDEVCFVRRNAAKYIMNL